MQFYKILSVDESGKASYNHASPLFIVSGIIMPENLKPKIDSQIRNQDFYLIKAHNQLQSQGYNLKKITPLAYRHSVTSLSLVNKENLDVDIQIADALAPVAGLKYKIEVLKNKGKMCQVDKIKFRLINRKLFKNKKTSRFEIVL